LSDHIAHVRAVPTGDEPPVGGDEIHQATEGEFDAVEVFVDVRMVEFDVAHDGEFRQVVHELRPLVEIGRVILVAFDDEMLAPGHAKTRAEILHHAADEKRRIQAAHFHHPRRKARRRRLPVRARDDQRAPPADELLLDDLGLRAIEQPPPERLFDLCVSTRERVADDDAIRRGFEMRRFIVLHHVDAQLREHR
jgi:hypothetical protein